MDLNEAWLVLRQTTPMAQMTPEESERYARASQTWRAYTRAAIEASGKGADPSLHLLDTLAAEGKLAELCTLTIDRLKVKAEP